MLDCRQVDWESQEGDDWDYFTAGYEDGFDQGCQALFDLSPDGSLYDEDTEYTSLDCPTPDAYDADYPTDVPDDPETEGYDLGFEAGCDAIFDDVVLSYELYYGEDAYTADDCKAQGLVEAPSNAGSLGWRRNGRPERRLPTRHCADSSSSRSVPPQAR